MANITHELDFAQSFDGSQAEISPEEALGASIHFRDGIEDLLLTNMGAVQHSGKAEWQPARQETDILWLDYIHPNPTVNADRRDYHIRRYKTDRPRIKIRVYSEVGVDEPANTSSTIRVELTERDDMGVEVRDLEYLLPPNGTEVLRHEAKDSIHAKRGNWHTTVGKIMLSTNNIEAAQDAANTLANEELEENMGTNNRPVGVEEINTLLELLRSSTPNPPKK